MRARCDKSYTAESRILPATPILGQLSSAILRVRIGLFVALRGDERPSGGGGQRERGAIGTERADTSFDVVDEPRSAWRASRPG
jgi:hypothetical protein